MNIYIALNHQKTANAKAAKFLIIELWVVTFMKSKTCHINNEAVILGRTTLPARRLRDCTTKMLTPSCDIVVWPMIECCLLA